ncbi:oxygen-dependent coproporphyrinogen oxidase [Telmatocola sphagniphila]|uniref:coproporphyrinogen oxidase n=1 Tax=Telmatocola sphagniphila TaxID=1123043 RepID=A0A8E6B4N8_9BACT|nr:oxygen-dependent coproporphyrinogen oxidase [Telmatocola sphagniphila]QVL32085.1 oxygen-dependent coproporphyrinogen oxidase [Telmatocola sphagniphila]
MHKRAVEYLLGLQDRICSRLEQLDGQAKFREDTWKREGGGGGRTRVIGDGQVFEKGGVNFSEVFGEMTPEFSKQIPGDGSKFTATGVSLVIHPRNPFVPTVHANYRFLTKGDMTWFGGGADLTPYYPFEEDAVHFHQVHKNVCDKHPDAANYAKMKKDCDEYFYLPHRKEARGIGGIFFDYLQGDMEKIFAFVRDAGDAFTEAYGPIVERRRNLPYAEKHRYFQEFRRGRYVEFNLIYDRGTIFGLKTGGRTESILMSLPPTVRYLYDYHPEPGSEEAKIAEIVTNPRDWV